ncbi:MAG: FtsH protease activity modulator HflK [Alphaproteobacteria bacterium GM202ARS2]|nr:FtsH protease activity modulator HflK [Alphaproteobacteria bacterium GM202ARS2]
MTDNPWGDPQDHRNNEPRQERPGRNGRNGSRQSKGRAHNGGGGGGGSPFDLFDKWFASSQGRPPYALIIFGALFLWLASGIYYIDTDEQGIVVRFGKYVRTTYPGLHVHFPIPIENVYKPKVTKISRLEIGYRGEDTKNRPSRQVPEESLMLTGDENIVDINFTVFWRIKDARYYLFKIRDPDQTIKAAAESSMREVIGQNDIEFILTEGRDVVESQTLELAQNLLDNYQSGVEITQVQLKKVDPPEQVIEAYRDVQRAKADQERLRNVAEAYRNDIIPKARGLAEKIMQEAEAYKNEVIARAEGDSARFLSVLDSYQLGKTVTRERIYLETLENVFSTVNKVIIDDEKNGVLPYLPLNALERSLRKEEP